MLRTSWLESTHTWTHMNMDCLTISQVLVHLQRFKRHKRCVGVVSCHFQLKLYTLGPLSVPADNHVKGMMSTHFWPVPQKMFVGIYWYEIFLVLAPCSLSKHFRYTPNTPTFQTNLLCPSWGQQVLLKNQYTSQKTLSSVYFNYNQLPRAINGTKVVSPYHLLMTSANKT